MADGLPLAALRAEVESWPLASKAAFEGVILHLEIGPERILSGPTKEMWGALERELRLRAGRASLAELAPIRDDAWFSAPEHVGIFPGRTPLHRYLGRLASRVLEDNGHRASLRGGGTSAGDVAERWRWLSIYLPPELLLAALAAGNGGTVRERVEFVPPGLGGMLHAGPVAQQHLHIGAGPSVARIWDALTQETAFPKRLDGEMPLGCFEEILLAAGFARRILAEHVELRARGMARSLDETLDWLARDCAEWRGRAPREWRRESELLLRMLEKPTEPAPRRAWITHARRRLPRERSAPPHGELLRRCFEALAERADARLERVFLQYVRVYVMTYRHLVQDPSSCGLDWFTRHYERISPITAKAIKRRRLTETLHNDGTGLLLHSLEIRTRPETTWSDTGRELRDYAREVDTWPTAPSEWGVTFHLIKRHEETVRDKRKQRTGDIGPGGRYGRWYRDGAQRVRSVEHLLRRRPEALAVIRGIDVANVELAIPTWIVAPLLKRLRAVSPEIAVAARRRRALSGLGTIQVIPHVGEDYRRLSEGVRRMDEAVRSGMLGRRGRVGHGLALGVDPFEWRRRHSRVFQPLEERLFDLLWELSLVRRGDVTLSIARDRVVRDEAAQWGAALFDQSVDVDELVDGYEALLDPAGVDVRFGYGRTDQVRSVPRGYPERWLFDREVFLRGLHPVPVEATLEEEAVLREAQAALVRRFVAEEITIECNPSSNFLVGGLETLRDHPIFRLQPVSAVAGAGQVSVSLNSDDPVSFATRLCEEYAYTYHAMIGGGDPEADAIAWLDRVRQMGWDSRITVEASRRRDVIERLSLRSRR